MSVKTEVETATVGAFAAVQKFLSEKIRWADNIVRLAEDEKFGDSEAESKREFDTFIREGRLMGIVCEAYDIADHFGLDLGVCKTCYDDKGELVKAHKAHKNDFAPHGDKTLRSLSEYLISAIRVSDATIAELQEELDKLDEDSDAYSRGIRDIEIAIGDGILDYRVAKLLNIKTDLCEHCVAHMDELWGEVEKSPKSHGRPSDELPMAYR